MEPFTFETIGPIRLCVTREHRFGTDAFLLAHFSRVHSGDRACDLCAGCGIIPALWLRNEPRPAVAYAVELLEQPIAQIGCTVRENGLEGRLVPIHRDLRELAVEIPAGSIDLVSCNPPYFRPGTGAPSKTPHRLAARHEVSCDLPSIAEAAARLLRYGGRFCLCGRPERLPDAMTALRDNRLEPKRLRLVQKYADTPPWLFLLEGRKGGKPSLRVEAPLLMENPGGGFTSEVLEIYGKKEESS